MPLRSRQRGHRCGCGAIISSAGIGAPPRRLCRQRWSPAASAGWVPRMTSADIPALWSPVAWTS